MPELDPIEKVTFEPSDVDQSATTGAFSGMKQLVRPQRAGRKGERIVAGDRDEPEESDHDDRRDHGGEEDEPTPATAPWGSSCAGVQCVVPVS